MLSCIYVFGYVWDILCASTGRIYMMWRVVLRGGVCDASVTCIVGRWLWSCMGVRVLVHESWYDICMCLRYVALLYICGMWFVYVCF